MTLRIRWPLKALLLVGLLAATTALLARPSRSAADPSDGLLLAANRDRLALCVQPLAGAVQPREARALVQGALAEVATHPSWAPAGLPAAPPAVEAGCPAAPALLRPGSAHDGGRPNGDPLRERVERASRFRAFVFIVPEGQAATLFGGSSRRTAAQELLCDDHAHRCVAVTTGLYLTPGELRDAPFLRHALERAIGLEPPVLPPPPAVPPQR